MLNSYLYRLLLLLAVFSVFASSVGILITITSSAIRLKVCAITVRIKKYKSTIKKMKKNNHDKIVMFQKLDEPTYSPSPVWNWVYSLNFQGLQPYSPQFWRSNMQGGFTNHSFVHEEWWPHI